MSSFIGMIAGAKGCNDQVGAGTITAPGDRKIFAIGIVADAEVTNFKYTKKHTGKAMTVSGLAWMGAALSASAGANAYIPLGYHADSVEVASGTVRAYYI
jgi:hypothetical protein